MKNLKITICMFIFSGITAFINSQVVSTGIDVKSLSNGVSVNPYDEFSSPVNRTFSWKLTGIYEVNPGSLINGFPRIKDPQESADRNDAGKELPANKYLPPFEIENRRYISHYSIQRFSRGNEVRIRLMQNAVENKDIEDFSLAYDSGNEYRMGNIYGLENVTFPLYVKVTYRSWNAFHAVQFDVVFEFVLNYPGNWNVTLSN